jgi:hypothetical protein
VHQRQAPEEVPVGLVALLEELVDDARRLGLRAEPVLVRDLADHVAGRDLLEGARLALAVELVGLVVGTDRDDAALGRELGLDRGDLAFEDRLGRLLALRGDLDLDVLAELQRVAVDLVALGVGEPHQRHVGQGEAVDDLDLERQVPPRGIDHGAGDEDVDAGDVLL